LGNELICTVIDINYENKSLVIARPKNDGLNFYALPLTSERWSAFELENKVGGTIEVQAKSWLHDKSHVLVATKYGVTGLLSAKEIEWKHDSDSNESLIEIDKKYLAKIIKINPNKKKFEISIKQLSPNPLLDIKLNEILNQRFIGKSQPSRIMDILYTYQP